MSNVIHHSWVLSNFDLRLAIKTIWEAKCGPMCKRKPAGPLKFWRIARTGNLHLFSDAYWRTVRGAEIRLIIFHFFGTLNHILGYWILTVSGEDLSTAVFGNVPKQTFLRSTSGMFSENHCHYHSRWSDSSRSRQPTSSAKHDQCL